MTMEAIQADLDAHTMNANIVKDLVLKALLRDKVIDLSTYKKYSIHYQVIITRASWFKSLLKFFGFKGEDWKFNYVDLSQDYITPEGLEEESESTTK